MHFQLLDLKVRFRGLAEEQILRTKHESSINFFRYDNYYRYLEELENSIDIDRNETLGDFLKSHGYSALFQKAFIVRPMKLFMSHSYAFMRFN